MQNPYVSTPVFILSLYVIYTVQKKKRIGGVARVNEPARGQYLKVDSDFDLAQPRTVSSMTPHKNFANFAALKWVSG